MGRMDCTTQLFEMATCFSQLGYYLMIYFSSFHRILHTITLIIVIKFCTAKAETNIIICKENSIETNSATLETPDYPNWYSTSGCICWITAKSDVGIRLTLLHEQWNEEKTSKCASPFVIQHPHSGSRICPSSRKSERKSYHLNERQGIKLNLQNSGHKQRIYFRTSAYLKVTPPGINVIVECIESEPGLVLASNTLQKPSVQSINMALGDEEFAALWVSLTCMALIIAGTIIRAILVQTSWQKVLDRKSPHMNKTKTEKVSHKTIKKIKRESDLTRNGSCRVIKKKIDLSKYFWKNKKNKNKSAGKEDTNKNETSGQKSPLTSFVNLQHVNLAFDKTSEQNSFDNDPPTDSSYNSNQESPNVSYTYYHSQSESAGTSDSEYGRDHTLSSSTEHSRKSIRFAENLPTLSGEPPPEDGRKKIGRATVTLIPPPPPRGKKPLPPIEVPRSYVQKARKQGYQVSGAAGNPRVSMNPMPSGRVVQRKHSSGSRPSSLNGSVRGTSPHRRSGRRSQSKSPNRSSGRSPHRNSGRRSRSNDSANRYSGSSFDSNHSGVSPQVAAPAPEFPILNDVNKQAQNYSMGMHPAMAGEAKKNKPKTEHHTHIVAGNSAIQAQPAESQGFERNTQQRRSRSRKRRPRNEGHSSQDNSLSESGSQDIVVGVPGNVDSPPTMQMVAPGGKQANQSHASPLAQSSPQTQRYRKTPENSLDRIDLNTPQQSFDSYRGELKPRMPYDYFPPQSPGDPLGTGKHQNKTPRDGTSYQPDEYRQQTKSKKSARTPRSAQPGVHGEKISDPDSNYFSGSSGDKLDSDVSPQNKGRLVFQGVENLAFQSDNTAAPVAQPEQIKPKKRRRKSQNRGKNTAGGGGEYSSSVQQSNGPYKAAYPNPALGYSNDSMIYMDEATDTDIYTISSKKQAKTIAIQGSKSGETEL